MIAVTGANGYLGGRIVAHLRAGGADAVGLVRRPDPDDGRQRRYALNQPLDPGVLDGIEWVVHAAYDLSRREEDIRAVNFLGSLPLLDGVAAQAGRVLLISSLSAFEGTRSQYGRTKLELERAVLERGGIVLRPGLVFGVGAGGLFGAMVAALSARAVAPLIDGGWHRQFVTHDEHLCELVGELVAGRARADGPLLAAHEVPTTLRAIASQVAGARGRRLKTVTIPSALADLGLRSAELGGLALPFRSDSLRSLRYPIPLDQLSALARGPISFPPLSPRLWMDPQVEP
jgi:nucleoside-diphosphate-sugar epimerase